eukprot:TRINITY_DN63559_c0_g1_i1.p1 TRINITY_DN63559_c0_g1~~TRINITY_DN63559_c0_g1_i1.p1  ORF type:complete len:780 (-),score=96.82 TRINITY_DN63559_c0_g1_i1:44-2383(-)
MGKRDAKPRRGKAEHKEWLTDKRRNPRTQPEVSVPTEACDVENDFCEYYEAQRLFGDSSNSSAEYEALWRCLRSPLPVSVVVARQNPGTSPCESDDPWAHGVSDDASTRCDTCNNEGGKLKSAALVPELNLTDQGWIRRREFDNAGMSVWEMDGLIYEASAEAKAWAERENRRGTLTFQEVVAMVPGLLLCPRPEDICLDLCAAPGNKSVQLLKAMERGTDSPRGAVLSGEIDAQRCCIVLPRLLAKASSAASCAVLANARHFPLLFDEISGEKLAISRILVDVPCSGDGTARKNLQLWHSWRRREALALFSKQRNILLRALQLLSPGGLCVYSTCSLNPVENEAVVLSALRRNSRVELLDACSVFSSICSLRCEPGLTTWVVPSPQRRGPMYSKWADVPRDLRFGDCQTTCKTPLRSDMFPIDELQANTDISCDLVRNCSRFYPHHGNTGGFFVALFKKCGEAASTASQLSSHIGTVVASTNASPRLEQMPGAATTIDVLANADLSDDRAASAANPSSKISLASCHSSARNHPLVSATWRRVSSEDEAWRSLSIFFGIDEAWASQQLSRGLLFWQCIGGVPVRLSRVSIGVARLFDASPSDRRTLSWVRIGTFLFEHLPKSFLTGVTATRWQVAAEGARTVSRIISRRIMVLQPREMVTLLRAPHRQYPMESWDGAVRDAIQTGALEGNGRHNCGGVLIGVKYTHHDSRDVWAPAALTPQLMRLLVGNEDAEALLEMLEEGDGKRNEFVKTACGKSVSRNIGCAAAASFLNCWRVCGR